MYGGTTLQLEKTLRFPKLDRYFYPVVCPGMGADVSCDELLLTISACDGFAIGSSVAADMYHGKLGERIDFIDAIVNQVSSVKEMTGYYAINIMKDIRFYKEAVEGAVKGGADVIVVGAGMADELPRLVAQYAGTWDHPVNLVPKVSLPIAVRGICGMWNTNDNHHYIPDGMIIEGFGVGGHQGITMKRFLKLGEDQLLKDYDLEQVLIPGALKVRGYRNNGPLIAAGGFFYHEDVCRVLYPQEGRDWTVDGVSVGTRFAGGSIESGFTDEVKRLIVASSEGDVKIMTNYGLSPAGFPICLLVTSPGLDTDYQEMCICDGLVAATPKAPMMPQRNDECPFAYMKEYDSACGAYGCSNGRSIITCGRVAQFIDKVVSAREIYRELVGASEEFPTPAEKYGCRPPESGF